MSASETDFYELLGVSRTSSDDVIKKAYRKLARELHPDANPGDAKAEERFKRVTLAYEVLRDPERRRAYDLYGIEGIRGAGGSSGGQDPFGFGVDLGDIFQAFFGGGSPFHHGDRGHAGQGPAIEAEVLIDFDQSVFGDTITIETKAPAVCEICDGSGAAQGTQPEVCKVCNGAGQVRTVRQSILGQMVSTSVCHSCLGHGKTITSPCGTCRGDGVRTKQLSHEIEIPAGIDHGQTLRIGGKGGAGSRGAPAGDLYVHVNVRPSDRFVRQGNDLIYELHVGMAQASLGTKIQFQTLDTEESINIDRGTQSGKVIRLRGRGVPDVNGRGRGDMSVVVIVDTPTDLNEEQEAHLRQFATLRNEPIDSVDHGLFGKFKDAFR